MKKLMAIFTTYVLLSIAILIADIAPAGKKYNLSIGAIFKNEADFFKEWIEYHRLVGVDHFYLYNNGSDDNFDAVLNPYMQQGLVTLIDWPEPSEKSNEPYAWVWKTQIPVYEHACKTTAAETKWLALIDIDEFMVPVAYDSLPELLQKYDSYPGVMMYWHVFGTSDVQTVPENTLLIELLHKACPILYETNNTPKCIVKPELFQAFIWPPHTCSFHGEATGFFLPRSEAQINHYMNRTIDSFFKNKVKNKEYCTKRKLSQEEIVMWLNVGNEEEDTKKVIDRFIPPLRKQMGYPPNSIDTPSDKDYRIFLGIILKNDDALIPRFLQSIGELEYDKQLITLQLNIYNDNENIKKLVERWVDENISTFHQIVQVNFDPNFLSISKADEQADPKRFELFGGIKNFYLKQTKELHCDYCFIVESDVFLEPCTLTHLLKQNKPVISPLLRPIPPVSDLPVGNFFADTTEHGYYKDHPLYSLIANRKIVGTFRVPCVWHAYLIKSEFVDRLSFESKTGEWEFIRFAKNARENKVEQYICNEKELGRMLHFRGAKSLQEEKMFTTSELK